jgi:hypothetical protein
MKLRYEILHSFVILALLHWLINIPDHRVSRFGWSTNNLLDNLFQVKEGSIYV